MPSPGRFGSTPDEAVARIRRPGRPESPGTTATAAAPSLMPQAVAGGHGALRAEGRPQPCETGNRHARARSLVGGHPADRDDLVPERARLLGRPGAHVGPHGVGVLRLAGDAVLLREQVGGQPHLGVAHVRGREGRPLVAHRGRVAGRRPEPPGGGRRRLDTSREHRAAGAAHQRGRYLDRRQPAPALAVDGQRRHAVRQARGKRRHPGDVPAGAGAVAQHHLGRWHLSAPGGPGPARPATPRRRPRARGPPCRRACGQRRRSGEHRTWWTLSPGHGAGCACAAPSAPRAAASRGSRTAGTRA